MRSVEAIIQDGYRLHEAGDHEGAREIYDRLLGYTDGGDANVLYAYGTLLAEHQHYGLASYMLREAIRLYPDHAPVWCNLAMALNRLGREDEALQAASEAVRLDPDGGETNWNLAGLWVNKGHPEKVIEHAEKAVAAAPDSPHAHNHLALGLLEAGRWDEAWPHYAWRWQLPEKAKDIRPYRAPKWDGSRVGTLAIHGEQGIGDEIMFMGCLEAAERRVDEAVTIECNHRLVNLFEAAFSVPCFPDHASLIAGGEPDAWISMGDLPGIVGLPSGAAYMPRPEPRHPRRVGLTWRGGMARTHKRPRSFPAHLLNPLLELPGIEFVSVQYGEWDHEAEAIGLPHRAIGRDLDRAQALIGTCDLVVTVTQTAVHQAGAMGVPCWVLTPHACSWQFSPAFGDRMRWYDSVRLFRQAEGEGWEPVIGRVREALEARYA